MIIRGNDKLPVKVFDMPFGPAVIFGQFIRSRTDLSSLSVIQVCCNDPHKHTKSRTKYLLKSTFMDIYIVYKGNISVS